jgi:hypothetical protein
MLLPSEVYGAEWRDPKGVSRPLPHQGVLTTLRAMTGRRQKECEAIS